MALVNPGAMSTSAEVAARTSVTAVDADYGHSAADAVECAGLKRILVRALKTAGGDANSTITVDPAVLMGAAFVKVKDVAPVALKSGEATVFEVYGRKAFLHVSALTAATTWSLFVGAAEAFRPDCGTRD